MPELPEIESARRSLLRTVGGKTIARALRGRTIGEITREGKALRFAVEPWELVFHYIRPDRTIAALRGYRARRAVSRPADVLLSAVPAVA